MKGVLHRHYPRSLKQQKQELEQKYQEYIQQMNVLTEQSRRDQIVIRDMRGIDVTFELSHLDRCHLAKSNDNAR